MKLRHKKTARSAYRMAFKSRTGQWRLWIVCRWHSKFRSVK